MKKKLLAFEEKLKKTEVKKAASTKEGQYCISSERPTKHPTFVKTSPEEVSTEKPRISALDENEKTVVSEESQELPEKPKSVKKPPAKKATKKPQTPHVDEKKSTSKSV